MAVLPILHWPDPRLARHCPPAAGVSATMAGLAGDMLETMYAAPGRGLAAPQVGVLARMFVMDATWKDGTASPLVCVNPVIEASEGAAVFGEEGCLSIPGVVARVARAPHIRLRWQGLDGRLRRAEFDGAAAVIAQHELDHLDGLVTFDRVDADQRAEMERAYAA